MTGNTERLVQLEAVEVGFYSQLDEAAFFEWIKKIPSVTNIEGRGVTLFLYVDDAKITTDDLRELLSLFRRFEVSITQLSIFDREPFSEWLHDEGAFWFHDLFGDNSEIGK